MLPLVYKTLQVQTSEYIATVTLNRPEKLNSMNNHFWREIKVCFNDLAKDPLVRVVILCAVGKHFTAGLDLIDGPTLTNPDAEVGRAGLAFLDLVAYLQDCISSIEKCSKPVIVCIHGACIGGGIDLITACDIRLCVSDAQFCVKEVDIGIVADVGTIQRLYYFIKLIT